MITVLSEALLLQLFHQASGYVIDAAEHAKIGAHVGLVFFRGVPAPEEALAIDRRFEKVRLRFVDGRVIQRRKRHLLIFVHAVGHLGPGEVTDSRPLVAVFGVRSIEAELKAEGLVLRLLLQKLDSPVAENLCLVALTAIRLFFEIGSAAQPAPHIEHGGGGFPGEVDVLLAEMTGPVAGAFQYGEVRGVA